MYCPECGNRNNLDANFCTECGASLRASEVTSEPPQPPAPSSPLLWNPNVATCWSLLFTPVFGTYLVAQNWKQLGEQERARASSIWFFISILSVILFSLFGGIAFLFIWYLTAGRNQANYIRERYGDEYKKRPWGKPILIAFALLMALSVLIGILSDRYDTHSTSRDRAVSTQPVIPSRESYSTADQVDYRKAYHGDYEKDQRLILIGPIIQIIDDNSARMRIGSDSPLKNLDHTVILEFSAKSRLMKGDEVRILGRYKGTEHYKTVLGARIKSPVIRVDYHDMIQ